MSARRCRLQPRGPQRNKARMAEDAWKQRDPARSTLAYTTDSPWRNRAELSTSQRKSKYHFCRAKWNREF